MTLPVYKRLTYHNVQKLTYPCKVSWWDKSSGELIVELSKWGEGIVISDTRYMKPVGFYSNAWNGYSGMWDLIVEEVEYDPLQNGDTEEDI